MKGPQYRPPIHRNSHTSGAKWKRSECGRWKSSKFGLLPQGDVQEEHIQGPSSRGSESWTPTFYLTMAGNFQTLRCMEVLQKSRALFLTRNSRARLIMRTPTRRTPKLQKQPYVVTRVGHCTNTQRKSVRG